MPCAPASPSGRWLTTTTLRPPRAASRSRMTADGGGVVEVGHGFVEEQDRAPRTAGRGRWPAGRARRRSCPRPRRRAGCRGLGQADRASRPARPRRGPSASCGVVGIRVGPGAGSRAAWWRRRAVRRRRRRRARAPRRGGGPSASTTVDRVAPGRGVELPGEHGEQGGLAAPVGPGDGDHLPGCDVEVGRRPGPCRLPSHEARDPAQPQVRGCAAGHSGSGPATTGPSEPRDSGSPARRLRRPRAAPVQQVCEPPRRCLRPGPARGPRRAAAAKTSARANGASTSRAATGALVSGCDRHDGADHGGQRGGQGQRRRGHAPVRGSAAG